MTNMKLATPKRRVIVLDTAALVAGTDSLYALGGLVDANTSEPVLPPCADEQVTFYTTPDVVQEVRDPRARARLALLDGAVVLRAPSSDALAAVINFAKATGDFSVLSMTDLKIMALCWMLETERNGGKFLSPAPTHYNVTDIRAGKMISFEEADRIEKEHAEAKQQSAAAEDGWTTVSGSTSSSKEPQRHRDIENETETARNDAGGGRRRRRRRRSKPGAASDTASAETVHNARVAQGVADETVSTASSEAVVLEEGGARRKHDLDLEDHEDVDKTAEEDDNVGWINVDNLAEHLARDGGEEAPTEEDSSRIGCVTTDFAMQNTMLQMGLRVLSVDGRRMISKIRHYALRCQSCGLVTTDLERKFCGKCGNATMHRVAFKVNKKGVARAFLNPKKKPSLRGTKYPIPMPRGGRHNKDLILCEDQIDPVKQRRLQKQRERLNVDVLDPSNFYNAGAKFSPHDKPVVVGYGRRNPNEVRSTPRRKR